MRIKKIRKYGNTETRRHESMERGKYYVCMWNYENKEDNGGSILPFLPFFKNPPEDGKSKASAPTLPRIRYMCVNLTRRSRATAARAAATGRVSMSTPTWFRMIVSTTTRTKYAPWYNIVHAGQEIQNSPSPRCTFYSIGETLRYDAPKHSGDANLLAKVMLEIFFLSGWYWLFATIKPEKNTR